VLVHQDKALLGLEQHVQLAEHAEETVVGGLQLALGGVRFFLGAGRRRQGFARLPARGLVPVERRSQGVESLGGTDERNGRRRGWAGFGDLAALSLGRFVTAPFLGGEQRCGRGGVETWGAGQRGRPGQQVLLHEARRGLWRG